MASSLSSDKEKETDEPTVIIDKDDPKHQDIGEDPEEGRSSSDKVNDDDDGTTTMGSKDNDKGDYHNYEAMTPLEMLKRQLTIFRLRKNIDPTWKRRAREGGEVPPLYLSLYVASSFFFTVAGIVMLVQQAALVKAFSGIYYPWNVFGGYLILQGVVTHFSDTVYIDQASYWHPTDRVFAGAGILFFVSSMVTLMLDDENRGDHIAGLVFYLLGMLLSAAAFSREWILKANGNIAGFVLAHTAWHTFGQVGLVIFLVTL